MIHPPNLSGDSKHQYLAKQPDLADRVFYSCCDPISCVMVLVSDHMSVVSESRFLNLETRMRVSPSQSRSPRRDREFLTLTLRLRDETEKQFPPISGIETRSRFIIFTLRLRDETENSLDLISFFETRPRILKLAIFS